MAQNSSNTDVNHAGMDSLQAQVIEHLMKGESISDACRSTGINRGTYYLWIKNDANFIAEINRRQADFRNSFRQRLSRLSIQAMETLEDVLLHSVDQKIRLQAALAVLKASGLLDPEGYRIVSPCSEIMGQDNRCVQAPA